MKKERNVVYREIWNHGVTIGQIVELSATLRDSDIIFDCSQEEAPFDVEAWLKEKASKQKGHLYMPIHRLVNDLSEAKRLKTKRNNRVHLIVGTYTDAPVDFFASDLWKGNGFKPFLSQPNANKVLEAIRHGLIDQIHCWPSKFLAWGAYRIFRRFIEPGTAVPQPKKEKLFICMINHVRAHRMLLLDELAKHNLLSNDICEYSCLDSDTRIKYMLNVVGAEHYTMGRHSIETRIDLLSEDVSGLSYESVDDFLSSIDFDLYTNPPESMAKCLINLVSETHADVPFITEKTVWPLAYQMPFIIQGSWQINQHLKTFGFEIFEELVDYSFDDIKSPKERTVALALEIKRLAEMNLDYTETYKMLKPKLKHNLCRLMDLFHDDEYMPGILRYPNEKIFEFDSDGELRRQAIADNNCLFWPRDYAGGRNQQAVDIINGSPYLLDMYRKWV